MKHCVYDVYGRSGVPPSGNMVGVSRQVMGEKSVGSKAKLFSKSWTPVVFVLGKTPSSCVRTKATAGPSVFFIHFALLSLPPPLIIKRPLIGSDIGRKFRRIEARTSAGERLNHDRRHCLENVNSCCLQDHSTV